MEKCYNWSSNTLKFSDKNGNKFNLRFKGEKIVAGPHAMLPGGLNFWGYGAEYDANWDAWILSQ